MPSWVAFSATRSPPSAAVALTSPPAIMASTGDDSSVATDPTGDVSVAPAAAFAPASTVAGAAVAVAAAGAAGLSHWVVLVAGL